MFPDSLAESTINEENPLSIVTFLLHKFRTAFLEYLLDDVVARFFICHTAPFYEQ
jgi:hypothetical protein